MHCMILQLDLGMEGGKLFKTFLTQLRKSANGLGIDDFWD